MIISLHLSRDHPILMKFGLQMQILVPGMGHVTGVTKITFAFSKVMWQESVGEVAHLNFPGIKFLHGVA